MKTPHSQPSSLPTGKGAQYQAVITGKQLLRRLSRSILDLLFPPKCIACYAPTLETGSLCGACWSKIHFIQSPACTICHHPFDYHIADGAICGACLKERPKYDKARSVFVYNDASRKLITGFKYADKTVATNIYARWMVNTGEELLAETDLICPVPLHYRRMIQRRYNQSALLAKAIAQQTSLQLEQGLMQRIKHRPPQASLHRDDRKKNVKRCFAVHPKRKALLKGKNVLLIDDVMTTGATLNECAQVLKRAGAQQVFCLTLGRTRHDGE